MIKLGVNIDHVATLRQARGTQYPSVVQAALRAEQAGADSITLHLREDRRHIQDADVHALRPLLQTKMNLEMAATEEMVGIALEVRPQDVCLVPERREERTTEGGLDVVGRLDEIKSVCERLAAAGIRVSLFIGPELEQVDAARAAGAPVVEIHTGAFADAEDAATRTAELERVKQAVSYGIGQGLTVNAGHGLNYQNVVGLFQVPHLVELNIGHSIVARALMVGFEQAVREMKRLIS